MNTHAAMNSFSALSTVQFYRVFTFLQPNIDTFYDSRMINVNKGLRNYYSDTNTEPYLDIAVSFDGTWMTRGHKSHIGAGFVIDSETSFVLDCEVLCNLCVL